MAKIRVGIIYGGRSVEHEVSLQSAASIAGALDPSRYDIQLLAVDTDGAWHLAPGNVPTDLALDADEIELPVTPRGGELQSGGTRHGFDVLFPIVHGTGGEDGCLQGALELAGIPYVGSGVLGSALQMDKDIAKRLLAAAGLPVVPWHCLRAHEFVADGAALRKSNRWASPVSSNRRPSDRRWVPTR